MNIVKTRLRNDVLRADAWVCLLELPVVGEVVIGSGRNPYAAQSNAARFLQGNYPDLQVRWEGGFSGNTDRMPDGFWTYFND